MRIRERFVVILALICFAASLPVHVQAQDAKPGSMRINYTEVAEGEKALTIGTYFTLIDDSTGRPVTDAQIKSAEFTQLDTNTHTQASFKPADTPFYIVLLLDASGSMQRAAEDMRKAATEAINNAPKGAQFSVVQFDQAFTVLHDFTTDASTISRAISKVQPQEGKGTCLYDAAYSAIEMLAKSPPGRRTVILFTDGRDEVSGGKPCSEHSFDEVVDFANKHEMHVPINTIGLSGSASAINASELTNMAGNTGGFSAIGSQGNLSDLFKQVMDALSSQWLAQADLFPTKGKHDAVLRVTLEDGTVLSATFSFESSKDYVLPPAPVQVNIDGVEFKPEAKTYLLHLSFVSPQLIDHLRIALWDGENGVKVSENVYSQLKSPATFELTTDGLVPQREYEIKIDPFAADSQPIANEKGEALSLSHKMRYDPTIKQTKIEIASVAIEGAELSVKVEATNPEQVVKYEGWLNNEETNAQVVGSAFSLPALAGDGTLRIPMGMIGSGTYRIVLKAIGQDNLILSQSEYEGVVYTPPAKPSEFSILVGKVVSGLKANPWILIAIVVLIVAGIGVVVFITVKKKETGTPILQSSMEAVLGQPSSGVPINQTQVLSKPAAKPTPPPRVDQSMALLRVTHSPDPTCRGNTFMIDRVPFFLGRTEGDLKFERDSKISRKHAAIQFDPASCRYTITDLGSSNGLFLNGVRIQPNQPTWLTTGTTIRLGPETQISFEQR